MKYLQHEYKSLKKKVLISMYFTRSVLYMCSPRSKSLPVNIYHATIQKSGSQWIKTIFSDERVRKKIGMRTFPQHRYDVNEFRKWFPRHTFVPGLYISYAQYQEIKKPKHYKTIYVVRDPRDIVVSWYYSMLESHALMGRVGLHRKNLQKLDYEEGVRYCIEALCVKFSYMRDWAYNFKYDDEVLLMKFEEMTSNPYLAFSAIFEHCGVSINSKTLKNVLDDYTKSKMRASEHQTHDYKYSHYRAKSSDWRTEISPENLQYFYQTTGDLVDVLGYER